MNRVSIFGLLITAGVLSQSCSPEQKVSSASEQQLFGTAPGTLIVKEVLPNEVDGAENVCFVSVDVAETSGELKSAFAMLYPKGNRTCDSYGGERLKKAALPASDNQWTFDALYQLRLIGKEGAIVVWPQPVKSGSAQLIYTQPQWDKFQPGQIGHMIFRHYLGDIELIDGKWSLVRLCNPGNDCVIQ